MLNNLKADFHRLFKSPFFYLSTIIIWILSLFVCINSLELKNAIDESMITMYPFEDMPVIAFAIAVFTCFFVGTNFSSKTINNKLSTGSSKKQIYLSNFLISLFVATIYSLSYVIRGIGFVSTGKIDIRMYLSFVFIGIAISIAFASIANFAAFILNKNAVAVVVSIVVILVMFIVSSELGYVLGQGEYVPAYDGLEYVDGVSNDEAENIKVTMIKNPDYCSGTKRKVYEFISNCLPTSHLSVLSNMSVESDSDGVWFTPRWSETVKVENFKDVFNFVNIYYPFALAAIMTVFGISLFKKKQLS